MRIYLTSTVLISTARAVECEHYYVRSPTRISQESRLLLNFTIYTVRRIRLESMEGTRCAAPGNARPNKSKVNPFAPVLTFVTHDADFAASAAPQFRPPALSEPRFIGHIVVIKSVKARCKCLDDRPRSFSRKICDIARVSNLASRVLSSSREQSNFRLKRLKVESIIAGTLDSRSTVARRSYRHPKSLVFNVVCPS